MTDEDKNPSRPEALKSPPDGDGGKREGGMISRWAARKHGVAQTEAAAARAEIEARTREAERADIEARQTENRIIAEAIDIDMADYKTDFTPFLKDGVPPALRQKALKALWRTNPILANVDGLNDYDEDFRTVSGAFEMIKSTWEVGRGYAGKAEEVAGEMATRDEVIRTAQGATDGEEIANVGDLDAGDHDRGEVVADTPDQISPTVVADTGPAQAEPRTGRASLRQRLLHD